MRTLATRPHRSFLAALIAALTACSSRDATAPRVSQSAPQSDPAGDVAVEGEDSTRFEGRELAEPMSYLGASWLIRPERDAEEDTQRLHAALGLEPGQTACDLGAGNGYHALRMARAVAPKGQVIAADLQPEMLEMLEMRAHAEGVFNIRTVRSQPGEPGLPEGGCDLILLVDVYHEFAQPEAVLAAMRRALSEQGRIALVEYRAEDPEVPIKAEHKMTKAQIRREFLPRGFVIDDEYDELPWQHLVFFARDDRPD